MLHLSCDNVTRHSKKHCTSQWYNLIRRLYNLLLKIPKTKNVLLQCTECNRMNSLCWGHMRILCHLHWIMWQQHKLNILPVEWGGNEQTAEQTTSKTTSVKVGVYRKVILCLGKISEKKKIDSFIFLPWLLTEPGSLKIKANVHHPDHNALSSYHYCWLSNYLFLPPSHNSLIP